MEVYTSRKPVSPIRAWASSLGLLLGVTVLAWSLSSSRVRGELGAPESPPGWGFSYRVPRGFTPLDVQRFRSGAVRRFGLRTRDTRLVLSVWRFEDPGSLTSQRVCDLVLKASSVSPAHALLVDQVDRREERLAGRAAVEVESLGTVVRAVVTDDYAVAVSLHGAGESAGDNAYALFDLTCRSVKF